MKKIHIFAGCLLSLINTVYAGSYFVDSPINLRREIIFNNWNKSNPLFETRKHSFQCAKDFTIGNHNVPILPGVSTARAYYEQWTTDDCKEAVKHVSWIMTASREADQLNIQCKMTFTVAPVDEYWSTEVKIEPYRSRGDELCATETLFKSVKCRMRIEPNAWYETDCRDKFARGVAYEIEMSLGGPTLEIPGKLLLNPLALLSSRIIETDIR